MASSHDILFRLGRVCIVVGGLMVSFASYQLWGTGLVEWQAQRRLGQELAQLHTAQLVASPSPPPAPAPAPLPLPADEEVAMGPRFLLAERSVVPSAGLEPGQLLGRLEIPAIEVSKAILHGVGRETLRQAPGHYPTSSRPGQAGNVAIAGHRTTYGAPFHDLDLLAPGDHISIETGDGTFTYAVEGHPGPGGAVGHRIVDPSAVEVIADRGDNRLTLTACHPKFSARERIVVSALLVDGPEAPPLGAGAKAQPGPGPIERAGPASPGSRPTSTTRAAGNAATGAAGPETTIAAGTETADTLGWQADELDPTVLWATVTVLVAHAGWAVARLGRPRLVYALTAPAGLVPLWMCFVHLDRLLPAL